MKNSLQKEILGLIGIVVVLMALSATIAAAVPFEKGDIFAGVGTGFIKHFNSTGGLIETLDTNTTCSEQLGMAFDATGSLYATSSFGSCSTGHVVKFNNAGLLIGPFGSNYSASTESITIDKAQNVYVGQPDGTRQILKFDPNGTFLASFSPATNRGTDWINLASDQCTIYYTTEGTDVKRYDVCNNTQMPNFNTKPLPNGTAYAMRILPNGGVIVADSQAIVLLNNTGDIIATYPKDANETSFLFALNIDPDGQHFWTAGYNSGNIYKYAFVPVGPPIFSFNANKLGCCVSGLAVFGEVVAATSQFGNISGMKFNDINGNGIKDVGEPGLVNWTITLKNEIGSVTTTVTDASGNYSFTNLTDGNYTVGEVLQPGWTQTAPTTGTYNVTISGGNEISGLDFGNKEIPPTIEGRMTGGGSVFNASMRVTHGFELNCNASKTPNNLEVNWGKGNKFHLNNLTTASCSDDPSIEPNPPNASFDTYTGTGTGSYNGVSGATAEWIFTDAGEPGNKDTAKIIIKDSNGNIVLSVSGNLTRGNHQAHNE